MTGEETFTAHGRGTGYSMIDFWRWAYSGNAAGMIDGLFAEFLVFSAFGYTPCSRIISPGCDILTPSGVRLSVKMSAYAFSADPERPTSISFRMSRDSSDATVFCVFTGMAADAPPTDLDLWDFFVIPTGILPESGMLTYDRLLSLGPVRASFLQLSDAINTGGRLQ